MAFLATLAACGGDDTMIDAMPTADAGPADASATCIAAEMHSDLTWIKANVIQR